MSNFFFALSGFALGFAIRQFISAYETNKILSDYLNFIKTTEAVMKGAIELMRIQKDAIVEMSEKMDELEERAKTHGHENPLS